MDRIRSPGRRRRRGSNRSARRREEGADFRRLIVTLVTLGGLGLNAAVVVSIARNTVGEPAVTPPAMAIPRTEFRRPGVDTALEFTDKLLTARNHREVAALIRAGKLTPSAALEYLKTLPPSAAPPVWVGPIDSVRTRIEGVVVKFEDGSHRAILMTPDASGEWRIDFDAFARDEEKRLGELLDGRTVSAAHRLVAVRDHYFNSLYADEDRWACYTLKSPGHDTIFYGYCERGSPQWAAMDLLHKLAIKRTASSRADTPAAAVGKPSPGSFRVTLQLAREADAGERQFRISSVLADDWILGSAPFDELHEFQDAPPPGWDD